MANYSNLKAAIADVIKTNGTKAITGQVLQDTLNSIVSVIGANYQFAGVATPSTNPGTPDQNVFYVAMQGGTYTNFNATALPEGISLLMWNGSWSSQVISYNDGGVFDISVYKSTGGTLATFADLAAALDGGNNIPASARKGGMSVKFVQRSDNKYAQFRFMLSGSFTAAKFTNAANWQGVDDEPVAGSENLVKSGGSVFNNLSLSTIESYAHEKTYDYTSIGEYVVFQFDTLEQGKEYQFDTNVPCTIIACLKNGGSLETVMTNSTHKVFTPSDNRNYFKVSAANGSTVQVQVKETGLIKEIVEKTKEKLDSYVLENAKTLNDSSLANLSSYAKEVNLSLTGDGNYHVYKFDSFVPGIEYEFISNAKCTAYLCNEEGVSGYLIISGGTYRRFTVNSEYNFFKVSSYFGAKITVKETSLFKDKQDILYDKVINITNADKAIATGNIGTTIDFSSVVTCSNFGYIILRVLYGQIYNIKVSGGSTYNGICFLDSEKKIIRKEVSANGNIIVPLNAIYLIVQNNFSTIASPVIEYKGFINKLNAITKDNGVFNATTKFNNSYAQNNVLALSGNDTLIIDFKTGENVVTRQRIFQGADAGYDGTCIDITNSELQVNAKYSRNYGEPVCYVEKNSYYRLVFKPSTGEVIVNNIAHTVTVGTSSDNAFIIGCRRISGTTLPFCGDIYQIGIKKNPDNLWLLYNSNNLLSVCDYLFKANSITDGYWYDMIGYETCLNIYNVNVQDININDVLSEIRSIETPFSGKIRYSKTTNGNGVLYDKTFGDISNVLAHFKLALVKDGVVQYFLNQSDITKKEDGTASKLDGTDGDVLIVNDIDIHYLILRSNEIECKLFSDVPFVFKGMVSKTLPTRGDAPSIGYVNTTEGSEICEYSRNPNNIGSYAPMAGMVGSYVPSESGGIITYNYDSESGFIDNGTFMPTAAMSQITAEKAATNKSANYFYTNKDMLSLEIMISMIVAEGGRTDFNDYSKFGYGFTATANNTKPVESDFTNGVLAKSGARFKDNNDSWVYCSINEDVFAGVTPSAPGIGTYLHSMLCGWKSPWHILEQHLALSYASANSIAENTWFVYDGHEYKYRSVSGFKGLSDGIMTAVLWKKFRTKLTSGVTYNGNDVSGNDIEFVICSAIYRGWVIDNTNQKWVTGLNCVMDGNNPHHYYFYGTRDYKKYIMNKNYEAINANERFDFETAYEFLGDINYDGIQFIPKYPGKSLLVPLKYLPGSETPFMRIEVDNKIATVGKKEVTGVKNGYGAYSVEPPTGFLYLNHPRLYYAPTCGASFVCQNVTV